MISDEVLKSKVREKLESTDGITRLERALSKEIEKELRQELRQKTSLIRQQITTQTEANEGDLERRVHEQPFNSVIRARAKRRASERADSEMEKRGKKTRLKGRQGGFDNVYKVSRELADFVGAPEITRGELLKFMHSYFKANGLQDPSNRRWIISNQVLKDLFKVDRFLSIGCMRFVRPHIIE